MSTATIGILIIAFATVIAHGVMFFNDGMYGDGIFYYSLLQPSRVSNCIAHGKDSGRRILTFVVASTANTKHKFLFFRIAGILDIVITAWLTYFICVEFTHVDARVALAVALIVATYTGNQMIMVAPLVFYYFFHALFLLGVLTILYALQSTGWTQAILFAASIIPLVISFQVESHLSYFYAFPLLLLARHFCGNTPEIAGGQTSTLIVAGLFALLPVAYWFINALLAPRAGAQKSYYRLRFHPDKTLKYVPRVFTRGMFGAVTEPFRYTLALQWGWLVLIPAAIFGWLFFHFGLVAPPPTPAWCAGFMFAGFVLLVLGNIPYLVVVQPAGLRGWTTKNNMLIGLPLALMLVGVLGLLLSERWFAATIGFSLTFFAAYLALLHIYWIAIWAKHRSFLHNLARTPGAKETFMFGFTDEHPLSMTFDEHPEHFPIYVISMLDWLWGDLSRLVAIESEERRTPYSPEEIEYILQSTTVPDLFSPLDKGGAQAAIVLGQGSLALTPTEAGLGYIWHRFLNRSGPEAFLTGLSTVRYTQLRGRQNSAPPSGA